MVAQLQRGAVAVAAFVAILVFLLANHSFMSTEWLKLDKGGYGSSRSESAFVQRVLASDITGEFDGKSLTGLCEKTEWQEGLFIICDDLEGEPVDIRSDILTCLRLSIEAGASMILPQELVLPDDSIYFFDELFDTSYLLSTLSSHCPQMRVLPSMNELYDRPTATTPLATYPALLGGRRMHVSVMKTPEQFRVNFDRWLRSELKAHPLLASFTSERPIVVSLKGIRFIWPTAYDGVNFAKTFPRILPWNEQIRILSAKVLHAISTKWKLRLKSDGITKNAFFGAQLPVRMRADHMELFIKTIKPLDVAAIYIASSSTRLVKQFDEALKRYYEDPEQIPEDGTPARISAASKFDLLDEASLKELDEMDVALQNLVDIEVLMRASYVMGIDGTDRPRKETESSSNENAAQLWSVLIRRHLLSDGIDQLRAGMKDQPSRAFKDECGEVVGPPGGLVPGRALGAWG